MGLVAPDGGAEVDARPVSGGRGPPGRRGDRNGPGPKASAPRGRRGYPSGWTRAHRHAGLGPGRGRRGLPGRGGRARGAGAAPTTDSGAGARVGARGSGGAARPLETSQRRRRVMVSGRARRRRNFAVAAGATSSTRGGSREEAGFAVLREVVLGGRVKGVRPERSTGHA